MRRTFAFTSAVILFFGLTGSGCSTSEKVHLTTSGAPDFQRLEIVYDVTSAGGLASATKASAVEPVGLTDIPRPDPPPNARLRLEVQYPYPGVQADFVHVTLRVLPPGSSGKDLGLRSGEPIGLRGFSNANSRGGGLLSLTVGPPAKPSSADECLVLDMPKTELSALFVDLANDGYFKNGPVKEGESHLEVTYNEGQVDKAWTREPHLEQLVELLKRHGKPTIEQPQSGGPRPGFYTGRNGTT